MEELILVTGGFPYGKGETFLETEVKFLAKGFDKVKIVAINPLTEAKRDLPDNCHATALQINIEAKEKVGALRFLFSKLFWDEIKVIRRVYNIRMTKGIISTMLISLYRASFIKKCVERNINTNEQVFYSYWCDDAALALALMKQKHPASKAVCRIHRWDVYFEESTLNYLPFRHFITDQLNKIFSISKDGMDYAMNRWKVNKANFILSRLGIESQEKPINGTDEYFTIVSCSNLISVKRVELLAKAIVELDEKLKIHWIHIGNGPERLKIEKIIKDVSTSTLIELPGRLANSQVFDLYRETKPNLFINVSSSEGIPVSIMEAMSFGIPSIATDVGGNGEIVNEKNGILLESNPSPADVAAAISTFFDVEIQQTKSNAAHNTWKKSYSAEINYLKFLELLKALS
jgi:glycosyltransferase involved in cell wall biosynthesis